LKQNRDAQHLDHAIPMTHLGNLYFKYGMYPQAEEEYKKALELRQAADKVAKSNDNRMDIAATLRLLAALKKVQGNYFEAETLIRKSLEVRICLRSTKILDFQRGIRSKGR
jgi:tetratricopeptide (TPR) repeat protein